MDYIILILVLIVLFYIYNKNKNKIEKFSEPQSIKQEPVNILEPKKEINEIFSIGCNTDDDCNIVNGNGKNICKLDHKCFCVVGTGEFCHLGPTNYKNPEVMTKEEL